MAGRLPPVRGRGLAARMSSLNAAAGKPGLGALIQVRPRRDVACAEP